MFLTQNKCGQRSYKCIAQYCAVENFFLNFSKIQNLTPETAYLWLAFWLCQGETKTKTQSKQVEIFLLV